MNIEKLSNILNSKVSHINNSSDSHEINSFMKQHKKLHSIQKSHKNSFINIVQVYNSSFEKNKTNYYNLKSNNDQFNKEYNKFTNVEKEIKKKNFSQDKFDELKKFYKEQDYKIPNITDTKLFESSSLLTNNNNMRNFVLTKSSKNSMTNNELNLINNVQKLTYERINASKSKISKINKIDKNEILIKENFDGILSEIKDREKETKKIRNSIEDMKKNLDNFTPNINSYKNNVVNSIPNSTIDNSISTAQTPRNLKEKWSIKSNTFKKAIKLAIISHVDHDFTKKKKKSINYFKTNCNFFKDLNKETKKTNIVNTDNEIESLYNNYIKSKDSKNKSLDDIANFFNNRNIYSKNIGPQEILKSIQETKKIVKDIDINQKISTLRDMHSRDIGINPQIIDKIKYLDYKISNSDFEMVRHFNTSNY